MTLKENALTRTGTLQLQNNLVVKANTNSLILWIVSLILWLPTTIPYACHFFLPPHPEMAEFHCDLPTGFIQSDQHYYMINASKHFEDDGFHLFYGQPFSPNSDTPRIYFQPQILVLGILRKATNWDPATVFLLFGFVCGWIFLRIALALFRELFGLDSGAHWLAAVLWIWGGGLLTLIGSVRFLWTRQLDDLFCFDPDGGVWFLNLGRNLIYPMEAYYHAVFLGAIFQLIRRRLSAALSWTALLSISHPFTGIELILVLLSWALVEKYWVGDQVISGTAITKGQLKPLQQSLTSVDQSLPWQWVVSLALLAVAHLSYYFLFLGSFEEHRSLQAQWTLDWTYEIQHFGLAYAIVGILAFWGMRNQVLAGELLASLWNRLFLVWFLVAFALANHEFALKPPFQPLHFTRGYVWMALFLLGGTTLIQLIEWLLRGSARRRIALIAMTSLFLMDNVLFLTTFHFRSQTSKPEVYAQQPYLDLVELLNRPEHRGSLVVCPNLEMNYWLLLYCPIRAWCSHAANTPFVSQRIQEIRAFVIENKFLPAWKDRRVLFILPNYISPQKFPLFHEMLAMQNVHWIHSNSAYQVYLYAPASLKAEDSGSGTARAKDTEFGILLNRRRQPGLFLHF